MVKAHTGHCGNGGIQAHSAGPLFPMSVRGLGDTCQAFNGETNRAGQQFPYTPGDSASFSAAYEQAEAEARQWLDELRAQESRQVRQAA